MSIKEQLIQRLESLTDQELLNVHQYVDFLCYCKDNPGSIQNDEEESLVMFQTDEQKKIRQRLAFIPDEKRKIFIQSLTRAVSADARREVEEKGYSGYSWDGELYSVGLYKEYPNVVESILKIFKV